MHNPAPAVFGPVPSRRLGRSLGVDLVPLKTCSYDCVYCQLGRTTERTIQRKPWAPVDEVLAAVEGRLSTRPDYITLSGSGEPTLCIDIGHIIDRLKTMTDVPVAVLTNGSLLWQEEVRRELAPADLVIPSLDAACQATFQAVNRPCPEISFPQVLKGLLKFREIYQRALWLEVFLLEGFNDNDLELDALADCVRRIRPDRVQLNTVARPPAECAARAVPVDRMRRSAARFDPPAEVISRSAQPRSRHAAPSRCDDVLALLRRRPCTLLDIADGLALHPNEVAKYVEQLLAEGRINRTSSVGEWFYRAESVETDP